MPRLSKLLEKLEDRLADRWGRWYGRHRARLPAYVPLGLAGWYFYGMFFNSLKLGTASTVHTSEETVESIWVFNPIKNLFVALTPFGLGVTAVAVLLTGFITKKGYIWFSGYKYIRDPRGFNMSCRMVVQSLSQGQEKYPGKEWENQLGTFDQTLYMGCNERAAHEQTAGQVTAPGAPPASTGTGCAPLEQ